MIQIIKSTAFFITGTVISFYSRAQEKGLDVNIGLNKKDSFWYQLPWIWVIGGGIFILLLVAMLKTNEKKA